LIEKIPPCLPLLKGGNLPLFGKEGEGRFIDDANSIYE
jgi:hypothetical protein